ncbi:MAG: hypothetical protein WCG46_06075 [Methylophilaceae bacterium]
MNIKIFLIFLILLTTVSAQANSALPVLKQGILYSEAKASLIEDGWIPIKNSRIERSSLYAQEIYERGTLEVVDCISMELDACWFRYKKKNQILEVKTITRQLKIDKFHVIKD